MPHCHDVYPDLKEAFEKMDRLYQDPDRYRFKDKQQAWLDQYKVYMSLYCKVDGDCPRAKKHE